ncbi:hypothetical protein J437_LFUL008591 [Ladona fulva]|uniref:Uncharacterized protein n=1 Tax=Ladona fulva TaxID=123851 RepID=A0A8K0K875_LADFU|nr:hypothetical protein J437_LFUL008591 [Ladona fulva]
MVITVNQSINHSNGKLKITTTKKGNKENWLLHHENAAAHFSLLTRKFLSKNSLMFVPYHPHSPILVP